MTADAAPGIRHHLPAGSAAAGPYLLDVGPHSPGPDGAPCGSGLRHTSLRVLELEPGGAHEFGAGGSEWIVLPLRGGCTVTTGASRFVLHGRPGVFDAVSDFAYVPTGAEVRITSEGGGRFALAGAVCDNPLPARYGPAGGVPVELRGGGVCSRQVNNFAAAGVFEAGRLIAVEVLTPGGNWSSYPPHKHDAHVPGEESRLEEIYWFDLAPHGATGGYGYQRVFPGAAGGTDVLAEVRPGDAVLVPDGWHGPSIAAPGHDMYYLNVMAGPDPERAWHIRHHPDHDWARTAHAGLPPDPRLPLYPAAVDGEER